jgi:hypothetical protein
MNTENKYNLLRATHLVSIVKNSTNLVNRFSDQALLEIGKDIVENNGDCDFNLLVPKCIASMQNQLKSTHVDQKKLLQDCLEGDCEYPLEVIAEMTPRQKVNAWLILNGIQGFTDDILDAISAAYGIILEPDLNR